MNGLLYIHTSNTHHSHTRLSYSQEKITLDIALNIIECFRRGGKVGVSCF